MITDIPTGQGMKQVVLIEADRTQICGECYAEPDEACHFECTGWYSQWYALLDGRVSLESERCACCGEDVLCTDWCDGVNSTALEYLKVWQRREHFESCCDECGQTRTNEAHLARCHEPYWGPEVFCEEECCYEQD